MGSWYRGLACDVGLMDSVLVNPGHVKGLPGRKTDLLDAVWLCELAECGLVKASFVPPEPIRQLRDLTRHRSVLLAERTRQAQRLEKTLEDAQIKISSVLTNLLGASGRAIIDALTAGERDPAVLANRAKGRLRARIPELIAALEGRFGEHHAFLCRQHLHLIDELTALLDELTGRIEDAVRPRERQIGLLQTIPGVGRTTAEVIVAETGGLMEQFPTAGHLASWAGTTPGHYRSAGKSSSSRTVPGNRLWLPIMASKQVSQRLSCLFGSDSVMIVGYVPSVLVPLGCASTGVVEPVTPIDGLQGRRDLAAAPPGRAPRTP
jgi:transposase